MNESVIWFVSFRCAMFKSMFYADLRTLIADTVGVITSLPLLVYSDIDRHPAGCFMCSFSTPCDTSLHILEFIQCHWPYTQQSSRSENFAISTPITKKLSYVYCLATATNHWISLWLAFLAWVKSLLSAVAQPKTCWWPFPSVQTYSIEPCTW